MGSEPWRAEEDAFLAGERRKLRSRVGEAMAGFAGDFVGEVTLFATFTFDPLAMGGMSEEALKEARRQLAVPAVSTWCARRRFQYFLDHASEAVGRLVMGVIAVEEHRSGQPHGHGLLGIEGGLVYPDVQNLSFLWRGRRPRGNGFIKLEEPRSEEDVTNYCAKYMAKDASEMVFAHGLRLFGGK
jgi:hypothetical protein